MSWDDAANYLLGEKVALEDALTYGNKSVENEDRYDNEMTKSKVLLPLNRKDESTAAEKRALDLASPLQIHLYARGLQGEKRNDEAFAIFRENAKKHPDMWFVHPGLARGEFGTAAWRRRAAAGILAAVEDGRGDGARLGKLIRRQGEDERYRKSRRRRLPALVAANGWGGSNSAGAWDRVGRTRQ